MLDIEYKNAQNQNAEQLSFVHLCSARYEKRKAIGVNCYVSERLSRFHFGKRLALDI